MSTPHDKGLERIEEIMNWVLPGMTMFYRDSQLPEEIQAKYVEGEIIRSATFVDVAGYAGKPAKNTRFIIASSKAAPLYEINPATEKWKFHSIGCNSYFKVLDVYDAYEIRQIFLMHIPYMGKEVLRRMVIKIGDRNIEQEIIGKARKSLHDKWILPIAEALEEPDWVHRTSFPIGLDANNQLFPLEVSEPLMIMAKPMDSAIRKMTEDTTDLNVAPIMEAPKPEPIIAPVLPTKEKKETKPVAKKSWWDRLFK